MIVLVIHSHKTHREMIVVNNKSELKSLIDQRIRIERNSNCNLNDIDVSRVTDMSDLFRNSKFNGDISKWDVSNVENMSGMFACSEFNGDISNWDVSKVKSMSYMFSGSSFRGDISKWNVSNVEDMHCMFYNSPLDPLSGREPKWYRPW